MHLILLETVDTSPGKLNLQVNSICDSKTTLQIQYDYSLNRCAMNFILYCEILHFTMWYFTVVYSNINTTLLVVDTQYDIETIVNYNWYWHDQLSMCSYTIHYYDNKSISNLSHEIQSQKENLLYERIIRNDCKSKKFYNNYSRFSDFVSYDFDFNSNRVKWIFWKIRNY